MKPKNRDNVYIVIREMQGTRTAVLGAFYDLLEADDKKDAWAAEWFDKTKGLPADFNVVVAPYYG
jgi:arginine utilization protein RocB